ncbi:MAG: BtpA/SgcQ family protein [Acidimicrobiia bacterium]|nr:BtpA/SgcQ family protein [Acidimicrobiia bacterium]
MKLPSLIGMVHLRPLPGSPAYRDDFREVMAAASDDSQTLAEAGFPAVMVENFGDAPFFAEAVPAVTVAAMTMVVAAVADAAGVPVGLNVLRNDALAALSVAAVTGAGFVRVNVLTGTMYTDQGLISGRAAEVARLRRSLCPQVGVLADVFVKHASPPFGLTIEQAGADTWERGGADALIVSGAGTGAEPDLDDARRLRAAVGGAMILVGSGAAADNIARLAEVADGAIIGTSLKEDGRVTGPVDPRRAAATVAAAARVGWI